MKRNVFARARIEIDRSTSGSVSGLSNSPNGSFSQSSEDCITQAASIGSVDPWKETIDPGLDHVVQNIVASEEEPKLGATFNFTPEEHVLLNRFLVEWRKRNPGIRKREEAIIRLVREYMDSPPLGKSDNKLGEADDSNELRITVVEPPNEVVIHHCPECEWSAVVTDRGEIAVGKPLLEQALCDGIVYVSTGKAQAGNNGASCEPVGKVPAGSKGAGMEAASVGSEKETVCANTGKDVEIPTLPGRKRKAVTPALRKRIILRDRGRCNTPGCPHTKYLEIHHLIPQSRGGTNDPSNLTTVCGRCHKNIHLGKLKIRGAYPDIEFFHEGPDRAEEPLGTEFYSRRGRRTARVKEQTPA